jgi:hypothetical protein
MKDGHAQFSGSIPAAYDRYAANRADDAATGFVHGNPVAVAIVERDPALLPVITKAVAQPITDRFGETDIRAPMRAIVVQARA